MPIIALEHDCNSADFRANQAAMLEQIEAVNAIKQKVLERSMLERKEIKIQD